MTYPLSARVVKTSGRFVHVKCPYCHGTHQHNRFVIGALEHRAAGCPIGTPIGHAQRTAGYTFIVEEEHQVHTKKSEVTP